MWSVGCIFEEMVAGKQIFMGKSNVDQLKKIFYIMGTPNEKTFPGLEDLPEWDNEDYKFENYQQQDIRKFVPRLDENGIDLLLKMLQIDPDKRISAADSLKHPFFDDLSQDVLDMYKDEENN